MSPGTQVESTCAIIRVKNVFKLIIAFCDIIIMKVKNRRGPKIDPCGTPDWITLGFESTLFIDTHYSLFVRYEWNQTKAIPGTPQVFNFDSRISWLTQSNALRKSRNKANTILPESICLYKYCKKCKMPWVVDFLAWNPYCCLCRIELFFQVIIQLCICYFFKYLAKNR